MRQAQVLDRMRFRMGLPNLLLAGQRDVTLSDLATRMAPNYCRTPVALRFGTKPTGMRVTSFIDLTSTTETSLVTGLAT